MAVIFALLIAMVLRFTLNRLGLPGGLSTALAWVASGLVVGSLHADWRCAARYVVIAALVGGAMAILLHHASYPAAHGLIQFEIALRAVLCATAAVFGCVLSRPAESSAVGHTNRR